MPFSLNRGTYSYAVDKVRDHPTLAAHGAQKNRRVGRRWLRPPPPRVRPIQQYALCPPTPAEKNIRRHGRWLVGNGGLASVKRVQRFARSTISAQCPYVSCRVLIFRRPVLSRGTKTQNSCKHKIVAREFVARNKSRGRSLGNARTPTLGQAPIEVTAYYRARRGTAVNMREKSLHTEIALSHETDHVGCRHVRWALMWLVPCTT